MRSEVRPLQSGFFLEVEEFEVKGRPEDPQLHTPAGPPNHKSNTYIVHIITNCVLSTFIIIIFAAPLPPTPPIHKLLVLVIVDFTEEDDEEIVNSRIITKSSFSLILSFRTESESLLQPETRQEYEYIITIHEESLDYCAKRI